MTAVAQAPNFLSVPGSWNGSGPSKLNSVTHDDVARIFIKGQRSSSMSSVSSTSGTSNGSEAGWGTSVNGKKKGVSRAATRGANATWATKSDMMRVPGSSNQPQGGLLAGSNSSINGNHQAMPILPSQHLISGQTQQNGGPLPPSYLMLLPLNGTFDRKFIPLPYWPDTLRIGRQTNNKTTPTQNNGYFDSKVLSRQHAEIWAEKLNGRVWIRDIKSSNGTFVNGQRLSQENRDSEPHELRAEDVLELGIDIVGEDNKTIIHHKVAARVEHAGLQTPNVGNFDLNFVDIDPMNSVSIMNPQNNSAPLQNTSIRGRSGSQGSRSSVMSGGPASHRQPQMMITPVTMEMVVKKLNYELQSAKQQSQDLQRTSEVFDSLLSSRPIVALGHIAPSANPAPTEPLPAPPVPTHTGLAQRQVSPPSLIPLSTHIQEHPRGQQLSDSSRNTPKLRSEKTERPEPPQHLHGLVGALEEARGELQAKTIRVRELEETLKRERSAREVAEVRAAQLENASRGVRETARRRGFKEFDAEKIRADEAIGLSDEVHELRNEKSLDCHPGALDEEDRDIYDDDDAASVTVDPSAQAAAEAAERLQRRVEQMMAELQSAKEEIERYKRQAEASEHESIKSKKTLGEMVEKIRKDEQARKLLHEREVASQTDSVAVKNTGIQVSSEGIEEAAEDFHLNGTIKPTGGKTAALNESRNSGEMINKRSKECSLAISKRDAAPYASMIGVMLIGVGLMAVLNRWHKTEG
ncbi:unnamed protein product [Tuber melanosporum]|uniref:(Perigord truffle) hypothetical protein n=1 Tax=Tuber melanosporum (strain Mel28) TaxID=656061 RepID=D5GCM4_TUBMM|nr:uncharacterized protein GSTUM_00000728001 [Tuber melanosporum]CAZ82267.1 unnamed protein product [Tuber melanosporum]